MKQNGKNKLAFNKASVTELNTQSMSNINGGTYMPSSVVTIITILKDLQDITNGGSVQN